MVPAGAGGDDAEVGSPESVRDRDLAGKRVRHHPGDEERTYSSRAAFEHCLEVLVERLHPSDARPDHDAEAIEIDVRVTEGSVIESEGRSGKHKLGRAIETPSLLGVDVLVRIEVVDRGGDLHFDSR